MCSIRAAGFLVVSALIACLPAERINRSCEWKGDAGRHDRAHLVEDIRVAQDLGIRYGDSVGGRIWNEANSRARERCTEASFGVIMRQHNVSRADINALIGARDLWFDFLTVMLPTALLFAAASRQVVRHVAAGYDASDRPIMIAVLTALTPIAAAIGLGIGQIWGVVVEEARLRSDHISYRAANTPMYEYKWTVFALAAGIFLTFVASEVFHRRSRA